jgi:hypothetical protein
VDSHQHRQQHTDGYRDGDTHRYGYCHANLDADLIRHRDGDAIGYADRDRYRDADLDLYTVRHSNEYAHAVGYGDLYAHFNRYANLYTVGYCHAN